MELKEIISVPGKSGLFRIIASNKNGFIVESLVDGKRTMVNNSQRIMSLSDISVYTKDGEIPLRSVFKKILENGKGKSFDTKGEDGKLREFFKGVVPEFDEEKVYSSEIRKMLVWYESLRDKIDFSKEEKEEENDELKTSSDQEKPIPKHHEAHGPKTEHAKASTARTRKKV